MSAEIQSNSCADIEHLARVSVGGRPRWGGCLLDFAGALVVALDLLEGGMCLEGFPFISTPHAGAQPRELCRMKSDMSWARLRRAGRQSRFSWQALVQISSSGSLQTLDTPARETAVFAWLVVIRGGREEAASRFQVSGVVC